MYIFDYIYLYLYICISHIFIQLPSLPSRAARSIKESMEEALDKHAGMYPAVTGQQ